MFVLIGAMELKAAIAQEIIYNRLLQVWFGIDDHYLKASNQPFQTGALSLANYPCGLSSQSIIAALKIIWHDHL
jgi:hypothetical protein